MKKVLNWILLLAMLLSVTSLAEVAEPEITEPELVIAAEEEAAEPETEEAAEDGEPEVVPAPEEPEILEAPDEDDCAHARTKACFYSTNDGATYTDKGAYHVVSAPIYEVTVCAVCGDELSEKKLGIRDTWSSEHYDSGNGKCECGHKITGSSCAHKHTDTDTYEDHDWESASDTGSNKEHSVDATKMTITYCKDCGAVLNEKPGKYYKAMEEHDYCEPFSWSPSECCYSCEHTNTCKHGKTKTETADWYYGSTDNGDGKYHTEHAIKVKYVECEVCDAVLSSQVVTYDDTEKEKHEFNANGVCYMCGYVKGGSSSAAKVSKVELNKSGTQKLAVGETLQLSVTVTPSTAETTLSWLSGNLKVASVEPSGKVTAVGEGKAKITVKSANGKKDTVTVQVIDPYKPDSVAFEDKEITLAVGKTATLKAVLTPSTAKTTLTWESGKAKVATVDANGKVTAVAEGKAKITVKTANGKKAKLTVKVVDPYKPESVTLKYKETTLAVGETVKLSNILTLTPDTAKATFTWTSSKAKVATVDASGKVTAVAEGKAKITVKTHNGKKATIAVKVIDPFKPESIFFKDKEITLDVGKTATLKAILTPDTAKTTFTWESGKKKVAIVDATGKVTALAEGKAKITVKTHNGKKAKITVKVVDPYKPEDVSFSEKTITLKVGGTIALKPILKPATAKTTFTWKSGKARVATVDADGKVTAVKAGKAKITVKTANGKKASITIEVVE